MKSFMDRKPMTSNTQNRQQNDRVCIQMKGRLFSIPREDYERLMAEQTINGEQGDRIRLISTGPGSRAQLASYFGRTDTIEHTLPEISRTRLSQTPKAEHNSLNTADNVKSSTEHLFSRASSGPTISKETFIDEHADENSPKKHPVELNNPKAPQNQQHLPQPSSSEMTERLFQLRSSVVNTIDQFINQIETGEDGGNTAAAVNDISKTLSLHPSGDGSTLDYRKQNLQLQQTESFARNTKIIRAKLYREIDTMVKRLQDLDSLE